MDQTREKNQKPWNYLRLDAIFADASEDLFNINVNYYDHSSVSWDINCQFTKRRLWELAYNVLIGCVSPQLWSNFMSRMHKRGAIIQKAKVFAATLAKDYVDILIGVPPACPLKQ